MKKTGWEIFQRMQEEETRICNLDMTEEGTRAAFCSMMRNGFVEDAIAESFDVFMENVISGRYPQSLDFKTLLQYGEGVNGFVDTFFVCRAFHNRSAGQVELEFSGAFTEDIKEMYWCVTFPGGGHSVSGRYENIRICADTVLIDVEEVETVEEGLVGIAWRSASTNTVKVQSQRFYVSSWQGEIKSFVLQDPVKKGAAHSFILVIYNREAQAEQPDYSKAESLRDDHQELLLECRGEIVLPDSQKIKKLLSCMVTVQTMHGGVKYWRSEQYTKVDGNCLSWDMPEDWHSYVPTKRLSLDDNVKFYAIFFLALESGEIASFCIQSQEPVAGQDPDTHAYRASGNVDTLNIHTLRMVWGCLAEDADILMEDGSVKKIREVGIGDRVMQPGGQGAAVINIYKGTEPILYTVRLEDMSELMATDTHPVLTDRGYIPMCRLKVGDKVKTWNRGFLKAVSLEQHSYDKYVYSLELEGEEHCLYANGMAVGDFLLENSIEKRGAKEA